MLQPQWQPPVKYPYNWPSFVGAFKLISTFNGSTHYLKIAKQFNNIYFIHPYQISGTWEGQNGTDVHPMTGYIDADFSIWCNWSASPSRNLKGILTKTLTGWHLVGSVVDNNGQKVGPEDVAGDTI